MPSLIWTLSDFRLNGLCLGNEMIATNCYVQTDRQTGCLFRCHYAVRTHLSVCLTLTSTSGFNLHHSLSNNAATYVNYNNSVLDPMVSNGSSWSALTVLQLLRYLQKCFVSLCGNSNVVTPTHMNKEN